MAELLWRQISLVPVCDVQQNSISISREARLSGDNCHTNTFRESSQLWVKMFETGLFGSLSMIGEDDLSLRPGMENLFFFLYQLTGFRSLDR